MSGPADIPGDQLRTIVERIDGDFFAVMGLPLVRLVRLMGEVGVGYEFGRLTTQRR